MLKRLLKKRNKIIEDTSEKIEPKLYTNGAASVVKKPLRYWLPRIKKADEDAIRSKKRLMGRSEDLFKNYPIAAAAINKVVANVVGPGLKVKSTINASLLGMEQEEKEKLEKEIEMLWDIWANSNQCDYRKNSNFYELQSQFVFAWLIYGEGLAVLPRAKQKNDIISLKVDLIENHRLESKPKYYLRENIVNGVEHNSNGQLEAYHFSSHVSEYKKEYTRVNAFDKDTGHRNVLCLFTKERVGQRVGMPYLTPVMQEIKQISEWQKSELTGAITAAVHPIFITKELGAQTSVNGRDENESVETVIQEGQKKEITVKNVEPGSIVELAPGENIAVPPAGRSVVSFDIFLITTCKTIGAAIGLPYEVLLTAFSSNYSASRASLLEAWKMYLGKRTRLKESFCEPVYEQFMDEIVARGYINVPEYFTNPLIRKAILRAEWYGPIQGSIDPKKEAEADAINIQNLTKSRSRIARENGSDWEQTVDQIEQEEKQIANKGIKGTEIFIGGTKENGEEE